MTRSPFDPLVDAYDAGRPHYPDDLYDAVVALSGTPWHGARVVEGGAGTGIATRAMLERGATVVPVDVGEAMLRRLAAHSPAATPVVADVHRLPVRDGCADLVTFAQAWHWVDVPGAVAEAVRVLRPGGALAMWWNELDARDAAWWRLQQDLLEAWSPGYSRDYRDRDYGAELAGSPGLEPAERVELSWVREISLADYEHWLRSKSYVAATGARQDEFVARSLAALAEEFPDGVVREPFVVRLWVARRR